MELVELAERRSSGLVVRLLWDRDGNRTILRYRDGLTGDAFVIEVPKPEALTAFRHPNAYRTPRKAA